MESLVLRTRKIKDELKTILTSYSAQCSTCRPKTFAQYSVAPTSLAIRSFTSIQASGAPMFNEQQARKMLTAIADPASGFDYACEYY